MRDAERDVDRVTYGEIVNNAVQCDVRAPSDDEPVLRAALVPLVAQASARPDLNPLHLVGRSVLQHCVGAPRTLVMLAVHPKHCGRHCTQRPGAGDPGRDALRVRVRARAEEDLDGCEQLARLVHQVDGYPPRRADNLRAFISSAGTLGAWVAELKETVVGHVALNPG